MIKKRLSRFFCLLISLSLLVAPLPLSAIAKDIAISLSQWELGVITENLDQSYVYLGKKVSNIAELIVQISELDTTPNSPLLVLKKYIEQGVLIAEYNAIAEVLDYADAILQHNYKKLDSKYAQKMSHELTVIIDKMLNGDLTINAQALKKRKASPPYNSLDCPKDIFSAAQIKQNLAVCGKTVLKKHLTAKQGAHIQGKLKVNGQSLFKNNVKVKGKLSAESLAVNDLTVENCLTNLCVNDLSALDGFIGTLSVNDAFIINGSIENLTVSVTALDAIFNNLTVNQTLSANNAVLQNLSVANCIPSLCVNNLSVVDESISGTLSVNNAVIQNLTSSGGALSITDTIIQNGTITSLSSTDTVINNASINSLSTNDLVVSNCLTNLCVNSLSVVDESVSGTLSVNNAVIQNLTSSGGALSITDIVIQNGTITNLSSVDAIVTNAFINSLSTNDLVINNCLTNLCVNNLSVVNESISGTLSADNAIIQNLTFSGSVTVTDSIIQNSTITNLSATDAIIQNITVVNCIPDLCVDNISVNNAIINDVLQLQDPGPGFIGLQAPLTVPTSYTLSLPAAVPTGNQVLRANATTPTDLEWANISSSDVPPAISKTIYVTTYGNDITGDGSFDKPYASLAQAINVANSLASSSNPITILISTGIYIENNSVGPLTLTAEGVAIIGEVSSNVILIPNTPTNNFILINAPTHISDIALQSVAPLATGLTLGAGNLTAIINVDFMNFLVGVECVGGPTNSYAFINCFYADNGTAMSVNNAYVEMIDDHVFGTLSLSGPNANNGILVAGSGANLVMSSGIVEGCETAITLVNNATSALTAVSLRFNTFDVNQSGASHLTLSSCTFEITTSSSDIDINATDAGTITQVVGCEFSGSGALGNPQGTCIHVINNASVNISGGSVHNYTTGMIVGDSTDTSSTMLSASALVIQDCTMDVIQQGSASLNLNASTATGTKIAINDPTNVALAFFDLDENNALTIGSTANVNTTLIQAAVTASEQPKIGYISSLYSSQAIGIENFLGNPTSWFALSSNNTSFTSTTTDNTKTSTLNLFSDTGSSVGGTSALRGWNIQKNGTTAELAFAYQNSDISGQSIIPQYTVMQLDGVNNQLQLPTTGTQIVFGGDTNLYRSGADVLKTDDNLIVGTLTAGRAVVTDPSTNELASSVTTSTELSYVSGVTSPIQTQINGKVSKSGDSMTGALNMLTQNSVNFKDAVGNFVGINAQTSVPTSYTISLPTTAPLAYQIMQANPTTPTNLQWFTPAGSILPASSKVIYVTKYGNDATGNGSLSQPYATLSKAINVANTLATAVNPITISITTGIYIENNSAGPLAVNAAGVSIIGDSTTGVIIMPSTPANDLLLVNTTVRIANLTLQSSSPLATGLNMAAGNLSTCNSLRFINFLTGVICAGGTQELYGFEACLFIQNSTGLSVNNSRVEVNECSIFGTPSLTGPAVNTGVSVTGSGANAIISGGVCAKCNTGFDMTGNSTATISGMAFKFNNFDIIQTTASHMVLNGSSFELTNTNSDIKIQLSGAGTVAEIVGCQFNGNSSLGVPEGQCILVSNGASLNMSSGSIENYTTAIQTGISSDTASTTASISGVSITNCTNDLIQNGSATLNFNAGTVSSTAITVNDATNVNLAYFDLVNDSQLTIGSTTNINTALLAVDIGTSNPSINYYSSLYSTQAVGLINPLSNPTTLFVQSLDNANLTAVTTDITDVAGLRLVSDTASPVGGTTALRGWDINKNASTSELSFSFQNSDTSDSKPVVSEYTVMQLDGFNNLVQLPTAGTKIVFDGDTNLYRSAAGVLKTDNHLIVGTLTPGFAVITDPSTNELESSVTSSTELSYVHGVTSAIQTQINGKVSKTGDSMSGALNMLTQNAVRFQDLVGNYVGINAQASVPTSYTISLPTTAPAANQSLHSGTGTPTNLTWVTTSASIPPAVNETIYVTKYGNDVTGNGSFDSPYASLSKAITTANSLATATNPVTILVASGIYIENNSTGPLTITAQGIAIVGDSTNTVSIVPNTLSNNLLSISTPITIANITFLAEGGTSTAAGLVLATGSFSIFNDINISAFQTGVECTNSSSIYVFNNCGFIDNATGLLVNGGDVQCNNCIFFGLHAATNGMSITGADSIFIMSGGTITECATGVTITSNASVTINAVSFKFNNSDVVQNGASNLILSSCNFAVTNHPTDINIQMSGAGTLAQIIACEMNGASGTNTPQATGLLISQNANVTLSSSVIENYTTGIQVGISTDTSSTVLSASNITIQNCTNDVVQEGSSTVNITASSANLTAISINDATNVNLALFDTNNDNSLTIGALSDMNTSLIQVGINSTTHPEINYLSSLYSTQAVGLINPLSNPTTLFIESQDNAQLTAITTDNSDIAGVRLVSDTASPVGGTTALRGWDVNKNASTAELSFSFQNSDTSDSEPVVAQYKVMQLDGFNNLVQLPTAGTKIVFDGDTNLYRSAAGVLKTDNNLIVGTLTPGFAVITDPSTNELESSVTTSTELSYVHGVTSAIQTQINGKVSKTGDSMSGALNMLTQNAVRFQDLVGNYVGINAQASVPTSYTISLPTAIPTINQTLRAGSVTATDLEWVTEGGSITPAVSETIYVTKYGNDITGNGSFDLPYASLSQAITTANSLATTSNPITILMGTGIYIENNSAGPLTVTANGISIVGDAQNSVTIVPNTPTNNLLLVNTPIEISNMAFESSAPLATGISLAGGEFSIINYVTISNFLVGLSCTGTSANTYALNQCLFINNGSAISVNNTQLECNTCVIVGAASIAGPAANSGMHITGSETLVVCNGVLFFLCNNGIVATTNSLSTISSSNFRLNNADIIQNNASQMTISGCTFELTNSSSDIDVQISGAGTIAQIIGCEFNGNNFGGTPEATGILVSDNATANISGSIIKNYTTGIQVGLSTDSSSTILNASSVTIQNNTNDIIQNGSTTVNITASSMDLNTVSINDSTNVTIAVFDTDDNNTLTVGSLSDEDTSLVQAAINSTSHPEILYKSSLYSTQAIGFNNPLSNPSSLFIQSLDNANLTAVTTDITDVAGLRLVSDTGAPVGGTTALRGWDVNKNASTSELSFSFQNSDTSDSKPVVSEYTVMQLDGFNNLVQLPTAGTKIVFDADTNLYRSAAGVLKTDNHLIVGTLTPGFAVITDPSTNELESSVTTSTELSYVHGVTSAIQTQINGKVSKSGDTMTGTLTLPAGTAAAPSLQFTGSTNTGLSAATANTLSFDSSGSEVMNISPSGVTIDAFTTAGVVHNSSAGLLTSSLIVDADITAATITNDKLANISSSNVANDIVVRDSSGNFAASTITANLIGNVTGNVTGSASLNVLKAGDTMTGTLTMPAGSATSPSIQFTGSTNTGFSANTANVLSFDISGSEQMNLSSSGLALDGFTTAGVVHNSSSGLLTSSLIVNADITNATIANSKLAAISSSNVANDIVVRDSSGNFAANIITANLTGNVTGNVTGSASLNVLKAGDTMTGTLTMPAGSAAAPSIQFTGSTNTGLSANSANVLSFDISGTEQMNLSSSGLTLDGFTTAGVVHNNVSGLLSSSLIVNADITNATIANTKLAAISSSNVANDIVVRDSSGNFAASTITANLTGNVTGNVTGSASLNVLKAGDTMTGTLIMPAGSAAAPSLQFTGSTNTGLSANSANVLSFDISGSEQMNLSSSGLTLDGFTTAGVVHNSSSGLLTSSLIVDADITAATITNDKLANISSSNVAGDIVVRDNSGNFQTNMITIFGTTTNNTDVATKSYVDSVAGTGLVAHTPAVVVSTIDVGSPPAGLQTIDGVTLVAGNRVLLVGQTNQVQNGLWVAASGNWTRPTDFSTGTQAGEAYVLILEGTVNAGSSWLCNTPTAIIDTNNITFAEFSLPSQTTGNNVGTGTGQVYQGKTGITLNFRTLLADPHLTITTNTNTVEFATDATNTNTASTIVARDSSGNFSAGTITASLTGHASLDLPLTGGTLTGTLTLPAGSALSPSLQFTGSTNTGLSANSANVLSFDISGTEQMNLSSSGLTLDGFSTAGVVHNNASGLLSSSLIVNADITNATIANTKLAAISSSNVANDIVVRDSSGNFAANIITANLTGNVTGNVTGSASLNVLKAGDTMTGALTLPAGTTSAPSLEFTGSSTGTGITAAIADTLSFDIAGTEEMNISSSGITIDGFSTAGVVHNSAAGLLTSSLIVDADITAATITNDKLANISSSNVAGDIVVRDNSGNFAANIITANLTGNVTGNVTGSASLNVLKAGDTMTGTLTMPAGSAAVPSLQFTGSSNTGLSANTANVLSFDISGIEQMNLSSSGLTLDGFTTAGIVHNSSAGLLSSSLIVNADITNATITNSKLATISSSNVANDIVVRDSSGNFAANTITANLIGNVTGNVTGSASGNLPLTGGTLTGTLTLPAGTTSAPSLEFTGSSTGTGITAAVADKLSFDIAGTEEMNISSSGITIDGFSTAGVVHNSAAGLLSSSLIVNADITNATIANAKLATISSSNVANDIVVRDSSGNFAANIITANLSGNVTGNVTGSASLNVLKAGDTMTGTLQLPAGTTALPSLVFTGSTTTGLSTNSGALSFSTNGAEQLKISSGGTISIDGFTTAGVVHNDASGNLSSSLIVNADISATAAITDNKLNTISTAGKVANSATTATSSNTANAIVARDSSGNFAAGTITANLIGNVTGSASADLPLTGGTLTGTLTLPAGTTSAPSLEFTGSSTGTGITAQTADVLSFDIAGTEEMNISSSGITVDAFTTAGVVHNSSAGLLSSSLIVNADITNATIANAKLATISSSNVANDIVVRDSSGNFAANVITANLSGNVTGNVTGAASLNVLKAGDTMTGTLQLPAGTTALPSLVFTGSTTTGLSANSGALSFSTSGAEQLKISSGGTISIDGFTTAGVVHNDSSGNLSSSLIVNADISATAAIADSKLATISTAGKVANSATTATSSNTANAIVARDASGNFAAGTISANLIGNVTGNVTGSASLNVLKAGDTMTGTLTMPAGSAAAPSIQFTGSTNTGLSANTANVLSFDISGSEQMNLSSSGLTLDGFTTAGVVHNSSAGLLSSSLIVDADITAATITNDKLANISSSNVANDIVVRDSSGNFAANTITANLIGNVTGSASGNLPLTGGTLTGTLQLPAGTTALPSLVFTGSTTTGLSASSGALSFSTNGAEHLRISSSGTISVDAFTSAGVVHNDSSGNLSSSLIVNNDIAAGAGITDSKLATISTAGKVANSATTATSTNTANAIVARDASGNFSAGTISANLIGNVTGNVTGSASLNVLKAGDTMTGSLTMPAGTIISPSIKFTGSSTGTGITAQTADTLSFDIAGTEEMNISSSGITIDAFTTAGVVHNSSAGLLSTSLIVDADITAATITNDKLANISSSNVANDIVVRDSSGNFAAGTITATFIGNLTGNVSGSASLNVLKAGDTMTGTLTLPAGTTSVPSLTFTGSSSAGLSSNSGALSFSTAGTEQMKISSGGTVSIDGFTAAGVVHNDSSGNLSSSLIVNNDIAAGAGITDSKLATISTAGKVANSATTATSTNTANAIVARDNNGNFSANTITANLTGNVNGSIGLITNGTVTNLSSTDAYIQFLSVLDETITGTSSINDAIITNATIATLSITNEVIANITIPNLSATDAYIQFLSVLDETITGTSSINDAIITNSTITTSSVTNEFISGNLTLTTDPSTSSAGNIIKGANRFIHDFGTNNTFVGINAGNFTMSGSGGNVGFGGSALTANTTGAFNTAIGYSTLAANTIGTHNTALGYDALLVSTTGTDNTALGYNALTANATGTSFNTAVGSSALALNTTGANNTAVGYNTFPAVTTGGTNIAIGSGAGGTLTTGSGNIYINANAGSATEATTTRIGTSQTQFFAAGINGVTPSGTLAAVTINSNGQLGTGTITNLVVTNETVTNGTVTNLSSTDAYIQFLSVLDETITGTSSINDAIITNATIGTLSVTNDVITNLAVTNLSVTNETVTGTLSVANEIATNLTATNFSASDEFVTGLSVVNETITGTLSVASEIATNLTATTLSVTNEIATSITATNETVTTLSVANEIATNLTATNLSATDEFVGSLSVTNETITGTLSVTNEIATSIIATNETVTTLSVTNEFISGNLTLTTDPSTSSAGSIIKGTSRFIHDTGTNNTFVGINAGNFTTSGSGGNSGFGASALTANGTGAFNTAIGYNTLAANTVGVDNTALGYNALAVSTTGTDNTAIGYNALAANATGTSFNTAVGSGGLAVNTTGVHNTALGYNALTANTTATDNTGLGYNTLPSVTTGSTNIAIGSGAGGTLTTGSGNIYINANAGSASEATTTRIGTSQTQFFAAGINGVTPTGTNSIVTVNSNGQLGTGTITNLIVTNATITNLSATDEFVGSLSVTNETITGTLSVTNEIATNLTATNLSATDEFVGSLSVTNETITGTLSVTNEIATSITATNETVTTLSVTNEFISGNLTLTTEPSTSTAGNIFKGSSRFIHDFGTNSTYVGINAGNFTSSGGVGGNSGFGNSALNAIVGTGGANTAVGYHALTANTLASNNTAVGYNALATNTTISGNTAIGYNAMTANTGGGNSVAVGFQALQTNTTGSGNTALGYNALQLNTTGSANAAVGNSALNSNTVGSNNTAVGQNSLAANTTGIQNSAVGSGALAANTTGSNNAAMGFVALGVNTTGVQNSAFGTFALQSCVTDTDNTAMGYNALAANAGASGNTAVGSGALQANTTGTFNAAVGFQALNANTIGVDNSAFGYGALIANITGTDNTALGYNTLPAVTTGSTNIAIGSGAGGTLTTGSGNIYINANAGSASEATTTRIGTSQTQFFAAGINGVSPSGSNSIVTVNASGQLGTGTITNLIITNATITNLSATDEFVGSLSVTNETITGTLSVTNEIATSITATNETVTTLSVTNEFISGNLTLTTDPSTSSAGNIMKGSNRFIHNTGTNNTFVGENAGNFTTSGTGLNTGVGTSALTANTTGANNVAIGSSALAANTIGIHNTAVGYDALLVSTTGTDNTAIGYNALAANATGTSFNTAVGSSALAANTTGTNNAAVGYQALAANTVGTHNTALGYDALLVSTTGTDNTALGYNALAANATGTSFNTAVGSGALALNTTGANNTAVGYNTLPAVTTGGTNIALGSGAGGTLTTGSGNIYINANAASATEATTTRIGTSQTQFFAAGINGVNPTGTNSIVTANSNGQLGTGTVTNLVLTNGTVTNLSSTDAIITNETITGTSSITDAIITNETVTTLSVTNEVISGNLTLTTDPSTSSAGNIIKGSARFIHDFGTNNTFVGINAGNFTMSGTGGNSALGNSALIANTTGSFNTAIGYLALNANTIGTHNTALGYSTLGVSTTGTDNTALGYNALAANATGTSFNTAVGSNALAANTTGTNNAAVGYQALAANTVGIHNTALGYNALAVSTTGTDNTAIGYNALAVNATGTSNNTAVGSSALAANTTGIQNTAVGNSALAVVTTGTGNIALGYQAGNTATTGSHDIYIGNVGVAAESNTIRIGTFGTQTACFIAGVSVGSIPAGHAAAVSVDSTNGQLGISTSSRRFKHNIENMNDESALIYQLRPVTFAYNNDTTETMQYGLIAEEVDEVYPGLVVKDIDDQPLSVQYHVLPVLLLNEMKKQKVTIEDLKQDNAQRDAVIQNLIDRIKALEARA